MSMTEMAKVALPDSSAMIALFSTKPEMPPPLVTIVVIVLLPDEMFASGIVLLNDAGSSYHAAVDVAVLKPLTENVMELSA